MNPQLTVNQLEMLASSGNHSAKEANQPQGKGNSTQSAALPGLKCLSQTQPD